jgi:hypothetical protein
MLALLAARSISPSQLGRLRGGFDQGARRSELGLSELQKRDGQQEHARQYEARR